MKPIVVDVSGAKLSQGKPKVYKFSTPTGDFSIELLPEKLEQPRRKPKLSNALYVKNCAHTERGDSLYDYFLEGVIHLTAELVDAVPELNKRKLQACITRALKGYDPEEHQP